MNRHMLATAVAFVVLAFNVAAASAQSRTVCLNLGFLDQRVRCPGAAGVNASGSRSNCNPGGTSSQVGVEFELWDQDTAPDADDLIGLWRTTGGGTQCATFNWSDAGDPPDVYVIFYPRGRGEGNGPLLQTQTNIGTSGSPNWVNYGGFGSRGWGVVNNCGAGATCTILPGQTFVPSTDPNSEFTGIFNALDSGLRALKVFNAGVNGSATITMRIDDLTQWPAGQQGLCGTGCALSTTEVGLPFTSARHLDGDRAAHEIGHVLLYRETPPGVDSACTGGWVPGAAAANDRCATMEGWASYVAGATWWDTENASAQPSYGGTNMETANQLDASSCANNRRIPGQAAKGFWDLDDINNEGAAGNSGDADSMNLASTDLLNAWDNFPAGSGNHQASEPTPDGINLWDFIWNYYSATSWAGVPTNSYATLLYHNCTGSQPF